MGSLGVAVVFLLKILVNDDLGAENGTAVHLDPGCYKAMMRVRCERPAKVKTRKEDREG
jgi:hypothetical protein